MTGQSLSPYEAPQISKIASEAAYIPKRNTKLYLLLAALLKGVEVDPGYAYQELNLPTLQARASELRKMGWPVRVLQRPHPKFIKETTTYYLLDSGFRRWMAANPSLPPSEYPVQEGRGRYTTDGA